VRPIAALPAAVARSRTIELRSLASSRRLALDSPAALQGSIVALA
jgi:hypothetical protein